MYVLKLAMVDTFIKKIIRNIVTKQYPAAKADILPYILNIV